MKPYNAAKVEKANDLFGKLKNEVVSYSDYARIKEEVKFLYEEKESDNIRIPEEESVLNQE